jgi:hypothetical protein
LINNGFLNTNTDIAANNANSENGRSGMEASCVGKLEYGDKRR